MPKLAIGLFDNTDNANNALDELREEGFSADTVSVVARENIITEINTDNATTEDVSEGAGAGALVGGLLGLLAGVSAITIPGIGPVLSAGALATALGSTAVGAGLGGLVGALVDLGIPDSEAEAYAEGVKRGDILLTVQGEEDETKKAEEIFARNNALDINVKHDAEYPTL